MVQNVLKDNLDALRQVSKMISAETGCNIIICDSEGEIIEATLPERIGRKHMGAVLILSGQSDEAIITQELEKLYTKLGTDTRRGYNYVITIPGKRVGSLGISGDPEVLKPIVRVAAKTIGFYISENLREKEKIQAQQALKKREDELEEVLGILNSFWEHNPNPIGILDKRGKIIRVSKSVSELLGYPASNLEGKYLTKVFPPVIAYTLIRRIRKLRNSQEPLCFSDEVLLWDGSRRHYDSWVFPVINSKKDSTLVGIAALDVTGRKRKEDRFKYLSQHDILTGLHNRVYFEEQLKIIEDGNDYPLTFISLDADCLKLINDTMGHDYGDLLLINLARIIKSSLREKDIVARVGGDEFIIILPKTGREDAQRISSRIMENINTYNRENFSLPISVSFGLYTVEEQGESLKEVLKKVDKLMYQNKTALMANNRARIINYLISALAEKDSLANGHGDRVADICLKIAQKKVFLRKLSLPLNSWRKSMIWASSVSRKRYFLRLSR
ncbi:MAG TPA: diguanylate cyclase [Peptococcaceae bacterium]|nr:diguanylate cyclase [Peptococcaceae bacterium]